MSEFKQFWGKFQNKKNISNVEDDHCLLDFYWSISFHIASTFEHLYEKIMCWLIGFWTCQFLFYMDWKRNYWEISYKPRQSKTTSKTTMNVECRMLRCRVNAAHEQVKWRMKVFVVCLALGREVPSAAAFTFGLRLSQDQRLYRLGLFVFTVTMTRSATFPIILSCFRVCSCYNAKGLLSASSHKIY